MSLKKVISCLITKLCNCETLKTEGAFYAKQFLVNFRPVQFVGGVSSSQNSVFRKKIIYVYFHERGLSQPCCRVAYLCLGEQTLFSILIN